MPKTLTFADRFGFEIPDTDDDVDDDHDSAYDPVDDDTASSTSSHSSDPYDSDPDDDDRDDNIAQPLPGLTAGVGSDHDGDDDDGDDNGDDNETANSENEHDNNDNDDDDDDDDNDDDDDDEQRIPEIGIADTTISAPVANPTVATTPDARSTGVGSENAGVGGTNVETEQNQIQRDMDNRYGARLHGINLRERKPRDYEHLYDSDHVLATFEQPLGELFVTEQMSLKKGLKYFGKSGADAVVAEMRQLDYRNVIKPVNKDDLSREQKRRALNYLMYLKQKRCGRIKARGCADGRKQRIYKSKDETSSPTVSTEAVFLTSVINAQERRKVVTIDIPGAFMHVDIDELIHMRLEGPMAELLTRVDPDKYRTYMAYENGKQALYVELQKALYGTLQAALLFWEHLTEFLTKELGFTVNPYDSCVVNKEINGHQCTILWHVDDLKCSHVEQSVLDNIYEKLNEKYGKETPLVIHRGPCMSGICLG